MQKLRIRVTGSKVHDVGYRVLLVNKALSFGVSNFNVFNTFIEGMQAVIVIIEADDDVIVEFRDFVTSFRPEKAIIEKISFEEYKNVVPPIERVMQSFQMEQWGKGIPILIQISEKLDYNTDILKENTSILKENTSILKENTSILKENTSILKENTSILKENTSVLKENTSILKENTSVLKDFKEETNNNFGELKSIMSKHDADAVDRILSVKKEISEIKERLSNVESIVSAL